MEAFTKRINIDGKQARYYDLQPLNLSEESGSSKRQPAHFMAAIVSPLVLMHLY